MEDLLQMQKNIENDALFYVCDWSLNQNIGSNFVVFSPDSGDSVLDILDDTEIVEPQTLPDSYILMSYDWCVFFDGILDNIGDTEYICYAYRSGSTTTYSLIYDLSLSEDGSIIPNSYNKFDYIEDENGITLVTSTTTDLFMPTPCYSSFGYGSDLRDGMSHTISFTFLFAVGFAIVFVVCMGFFNYVLNLGRK